MWYDSLFYLNCNLDKVTDMKEALRINMFRNCSVNISVLDWLFSVLGLLAFKL